MLLASDLRCVSFFPPWQTGSPSRTACIHHPSLSWIDPFPGPRHIAAWDCPLCFLLCFTWDAGKSFGVFLFVLEEDPEVLEVVDGRCPHRSSWWPRPVARRCARVATASSLPMSLMNCKHRSGELPGTDNADRWRLPGNSGPMVKYCGFIAFPFILFSRLSAFLTHCCSASACNFYLLRKHPLDRTRALQSIDACNCFWSFFFF